MTDYCTLAEVRDYIRIATGKTADDSFIEDLIPRVSQRIDTYCKRTFTVRTAETRKYDAIKDVTGRDLLLDDDLQAITTLTNGDGTVITSGQYVLLPTNTTPKYKIRLKASSSVNWTYQTDPEEAITVVGNWGYNNTTEPPDDIKHAAVRLTAWFYHQTKAPFETQGMPELGIVTVPASIPEDVSGILDQYVRETVRD